MNMDEYKDEIERQIISKAGAVINSGSFTMGLPLFGPGAMQTGHSRVKYNGSGFGGKVPFIPGPSFAKLPNNTGINSLNPNMLPGIGPIPPFAGIGGFGNIPFGTGLSVPPTSSGPQTNGVTIANSTPTANKVNNASQPATAPQTTNGYSQPTKFVTNNPTVQKKYKDQYAVTPPVDFATINADIRISHNKLSLIHI